MKIGDMVTIPTGPFAGKIGEIADILSKITKVQVGGVVVEVSNDILTVTEEAENRTEAESLMKDQQRVLKARREETQGPKNSKDTKPQVRRSQPPVEPPQKIKTVKKEEKVDVRTQTTVPAPARVEPAYCPICGNTRKKATDLVCGDCYRTYTNEAAIALAKGGFVNVFEWTVTKITGLLPGLEVQFTAAKAEVDGLQKIVADEAYTTLKRNSGGRDVPREIWTPALRNEKTNLWRTKGGNVKFAKMKGLESRIVLIKAIIAKANEPKPETFAAETVTPPADTTETAPAAEVTPPKETRKRTPRAPRAKTETETK